MGQILANQVLLAGVPCSFSPRTSVLAPATDWLILLNSKIILKGMLHMYTE